MSDIDRYLDEMFVRVAGQGAAGRRMLEEAEDHLRAAAADGAGRGLSPDQAEREAVAAFGESGQIAALFSRVHQGTRLASVVSGASLIAGLALVALAVAYLGAALGIGVWLQTHSEEWTCGVPAGPFEPCSGRAQIMYQTGALGTLVLTLGGAVLLMRRLAVRAGRVVPVRPPYALLGAATLALAGVLVFVDLPILVGLLFQQTGLRRQMAALTTCVATANCLAVGGSELAAALVRKRKRTARRVQFHAY